MSSRLTSTHLDHAQLALGNVNQFDLLDGHGLASAPIEGLVDGPEGALPDAVSEALDIHSSAMSHFSQIEPAVAKGKMWGRGGRQPQRYSPDLSYPTPAPAPAPAAHRFIQTKNPRPPAKPLGES